MLPVPLATWAHCRHAASNLATHQQLRHLSISVVAMAKPWRPDMNDVDRLSKGDGAKRRGTGNYNIPHRLNLDERPVYEAAKKKGYLQVRGTGYRKGAGGRKGNPLPNVYRQWCDAKATACIVIEQDMTGGAQDVVVVDLAPLRATDLSAAVQLCSSLAAAAGARQVTLQERPLDAVPFNVLAVDMPVTPQQMLFPDDSADAAAAAAPTPEQLQSAELAVLQQADAVRQLKASGLGNSSPEVQQQVQELLRLKADLQQLSEAAALQDGGSSSSSSSRAVDTGGQIASDMLESSDDDESAGSSSSRRQTALDEDHPFATSAIWQLPVLPLFFEADRTACKGLAKALSTELAAAGVAASK